MLRETFLLEREREREREDGVGEILRKIAK
jgi:hypothetical protein